VDRHHAAVPSLFAADDFSRALADPIWRIGW
jgi:hypothetical protein